ncbi:hypothetical protein U1E44_00500 [Arenibacter sp. GZD96]|uniref:hypothetical protein n=1 Tax=Aurantibrevibacter litoralis TaxID=3106030 RepID=UPI002AFF74D0|nr:hypothetical protein [Arenibacter sp. GZD-96]MEA1784558.1 hypothetical protein [Arenibacter sp. GZD-96]
MVRIVLVLVFAFSTCCAQKKGSKEQKVVQDTLYFNSYDCCLKASAFLENTKVLYSSEVVDGVAFEVEETYADLNPDKILNFADFLENLKKMDGEGSKASLDEKVFERFKHNIVFFVDNSRYPRRYLKISVSLFSID